MMSFLNIISHLKENEVIRNWTQQRGYIGDPFVVVGVSDFAIIVKPLNAQEQRIPKGDFEHVISVWRGYLKGNVQRQEIRDNTRFSKYIISILHHIYGS